MKIVITFLLVNCFAIAIHAQNMGIGVSNPTRARLEVWGASGIGNTSGLFGGDRGISLQRNYPSIGLNQYCDNTNVLRYMGAGHAAVWQYIHNDVTLAQGLSLHMYPSGVSNAAVPASNRVWNFTSNNRFQILSNGAGGSAILDVGRGTGVDGAAILMGTSYWSHFNYAGSENTYIRGGKFSSNVILNDIVGGKVIIGNGGTTVGVNTNNYIPPTTLEVRQSNGGMELSNSSYTNLPWEWRVSSGSPANFGLYYANSLRTYFSYVDGSLHPISDSRVKTNITSLTPVMERLMQLEPVTYMMKDALQGQARSMGFIAQQVDTLFPVLVSPHMPGTDNPVGLNYSGFNVLAVKGVQEEQQQIIKLEGELNDAEKRLQAIEKKLNLLGK